jgi:hypothetical protein
MSKKKTPVDVVKEAKKVAKVKPDVAAAEKSTPNAMAENATFGKEPDMAVTRRSGKTVGKTDTTSLSVSEVATLLSGDEFVGPPTAELKERFSAQKIPLQTDFSNLIDVADCGREAVGLSPAQSGGVGAGMLLDGERRLAVRPGPGIVVDSNGVGLAANQQFLPGMIIMFSGTIIPTGWALCDGNNSTPNLINRFILAGSAGESGSSGGATITGTGSVKTYAGTTKSSVGGVNIAITVAGTKLTEAQLPAHKHLGGPHFIKYQDDTTPGWCEYGFIERTTKAGGIDVGDLQSYALAYTSTVGDDQLHTHGASAPLPDHSHAIDTLPAYYVLAFIMKL